MIWDDYSNAIDGLSFSENYENETISALRARQRDIDARTKEKELMRKNFWMKIAAGVAATSIFAGSAYAAVTMMNPSEVASEFGHEQLAEAFDKNGAGVDGEGTQRVGDYDIAMEGVVSGANLSDLDDGVDANCTYAVLSVKRADGKPISEDEAFGKDNGNVVNGHETRDDDGHYPTDLGFSDRFSATPLVSGFAPWRLNGWTLGAGLEKYLKDGVMYYLYEAANLEAFADRTVYFAFYETTPEGGFAPGSETFKMNDDGTIAFADEYTGEGALFVLPLDASKSDPAMQVEIIGEEHGAEQPAGGDSDAIDDDDTETSAYFIGEGEDGELKITGE